MARRGSNPLPGVLQLFNKSISIIARRRWAVSIVRPENLAVQIPSPAF